MEYLLIKNNVGKTLPLDHEDITSIIFKALKATGNADRLLALNLADKVICRLNKIKKADNSLNVTDVEAMLRFVLTETGASEAARYLESISERINVLP